MASTFSLYLFITSFCRASEVGQVSFHDNGFVRHTSPCNLLALFYFDVLSLYECALLSFGRRKFFGGNARCFSILITSVELVTELYAVRFYVCAYFASMVDIFAFYTSSFV